MPNELFAKIIKEAAGEADKEFSILKRCHQAEDHPLLFAVERGTADDFHEADDLRAGEQRKHMATAGAVVKRRMRALSRLVSRLRFRTEVGESDLSVRL